MALPSLKISLTPTPVASIAAQNDQVAADAEKVATAARAESSYARRVAGKFKELIA